jgi:trehalose/maltose hydrolase-like predicted phosphorylase
VESAGQRALHSDITDTQGGTTPEGIHLAAMAGSVDLLQRCFAGVETRDDVLWVEPHWPEELGALEFSIRYRGHAVVLRIVGRTVRLTAAAEPPTSIRVGCRGDLKVLRPGETVGFPL